MCNEFARRISLDQLRKGWGAADAKLLFPEALPNMPALDSFVLPIPRSSCAPPKAIPVPRKA
jgi:hypothetical protein